MVILSILDIMYLVVAYRPPTLGCMGHPPVLLGQGASIEESIEWPVQTLLVTMMVNMVSSHCLLFWSLYCMLIDIKVLYAGRWYSMHSLMDTHNLSPAYAPAITIGHRLS
jgi:hypothetical protein